MCGFEQRHPIHPSPALDDPRFWPPTWLFIRVASWLILLHLLEVSIRALFHSWGNAIPHAHSALYFSSVTYTTVGFGDLVLPDGWH